MSTAAPTDQRAGVRPIAFAMEYSGGIGEIITLNIRPEDLTRNEPSRISVHQTLGRDTQGWVDVFGAALPTVTISGHTGWRTNTGSGEDGVASFEKLNQLIVHEYHKAKQDTIDAGGDPDTVKLLFIDVLDNFFWSVAPMSFSLKRNKSRPLLMQYNIVLQAISTDVDNPLVITPGFGSQAAGLLSLGRVVSRLQAVVDKVKGWVASAVSAVNGFVAPIAQAVRDFVKISSAVLDTAYGIISAVKAGSRAIANNLITIANDLSVVGAKLFRTITAVRDLPNDLKRDLGSVSSAFNEAACLFRSSLRPTKTYEDYTGLYGASNCSSTTGGRPASSYADANVFKLLQPVDQPATLTISAQESLSALKQYDAVLAPMTIPELARHVTNINSGISLVAA